MMNMEKTKEQKEVLTRIRISALKEAELIRERETKRLKDQEDAIRKRLKDG